MEYGCIGKKLSHSFSKIIHNELTEYDYVLKELSERELDAFLREKQFKAVNVTIPYKQAVIPYLAEIDPTAAAIGAVNTVVNRDGRLFGYNTDFAGMRALVEKNGMVLRGGKVLILGSGGTSKTAYAVAGAMGARERYRVSRSAADDCISYEIALSDHGDADFIINTTPCGMYPELGKAAVELAAFSRLSGVVDAVYNPLRSALIVEAKKRNIPCCGGLYMLVHQAAAAAEYFTGDKIPPSRIDAVYQKLRSEKENIVLIGMPGCGKSTLGRRLAEKLKKEFADTDSLIAQKAGCSIPEIFQRDGEAHFRALEAEVVRDISARQGLVIATGGGAVCNPKNTDFLKENGVLVFLDRPLDFLVTSDDRPLSDNRRKLEKLYGERIEIYRRSADITVKPKADIEKNVSDILRQLA